MQNASSEYKQGMRLPFRNRGYIQARIGIVSSTAQSSVVAEVEDNEFAYFTDYKTPFEIDSVESVYATGEQDFSKVDGSMYFLPPEDAGFSFYNNGLVSEGLLGSVYISFSRNIADIKGLTIDFGEYYPVLFTVQSDSGTKTYENSEQVFVTEDVFDGISYLIITPLEMVNGSGRLRIYQFTCGISNNFSNREVKSYTYKDFVSSISESLPSQDMTLIVDNQNLYYNPDNPESAVAYMEQGQKMKVMFGYDVDGTGNIEWVTETVTYLKSWSATDTEAKFTTVDIFDYKMTGTYYRGLYRKAGINLYDLALDVLADAGLEEDEYVIDPYLKNVIVYNPMPAVKHSEALQIIANAGRCVLSTDRQGRVHIKSSFVPDMIASSDNEAAFSHVENILGADTKDAYAICSNDFSIVDGSLSFLPLDEDYLNTGYISNSTSDEDGNYEKNPVITINLEAGYVCYGLTILFRNVAPQEFHIITYYQDIQVQDLIAENPELEYITYEQFDLFDRMEIVFTKGRPNARITVDSILFGDVTDYTLSRTYNLTASPTATRQDKIKSISVKRSLYRESTEEIKNLFSEELVLMAGTTEQMVYFTNASYGFVVTVEESTASVDILESSSYYAKLKFSGITANNTIVKYSVQGYEYAIDEQYLRVVHNDNGEEETWNNPLISTVEMAQDLEEWLATYYLGDVDYQISWNGDPRTDANDLFYLELKGRDNTLIRAYQNELKFNGAWSGTIKARKAVL